MIEYMIINKSSGEVVGQGDCLSMVEFNHHVSFAAEREPDVEYILIENDDPEIIEAVRETDEQGRFIHEVDKRPNKEIRLKIRSGKKSRINKEKVIKYGD